MNPAHVMAPEEAGYADRWDLELIDFDPQEVTEIEDLLDVETEVTETVVVSAKPLVGTADRRSQTGFEFLFRIL